MMYTLIFIAFIFAIFEWIGEHKKRSKLIYFTKPFVLVFLLIWIAMNVNITSILQDDDLRPLLWFMTGIISCLIGDIFLMFPERHFLPGLVAFLIGHVFYIVGFGRLFPPERNILPGAIVLGMIVVVSVTVTKKLFEGLVTSGNERLKIPIAVYAVVISVMLYSAIISLLNRDWHYAPAIWVSLGALSFYVSDILNAWMRFVEPLKSGRIKIMMTYHLAQISIVIGVVLHYVYRPDS